MTTIIRPQSATLIDTEFAHIPYSEATLQLNRKLAMKRDTTPFGQMGEGKFRRLFNRHTTAYRLY
uniref:Uncharacterized protein n=1 Tax=Roseihalotalea indica TaxID=2867963 RepID=A0AA49JCS0_9BACT|nr:hypothetical protein K4G66_21905 [Tunicatimonas sp. TK19036]